MSLRVSERVLSILQRSNFSYTKLVILWNFVFGLLVLTIVLKIVYEKVRFFFLFTVLYLPKSICVQHRFYATYHGAQHIVGDV